MAYSIDEARQQFRNDVNDDNTHTGDDDYVVDVKVQDTKKYKLHQ